MRTWRTLVPNCLFQAVSHACCTACVSANRRSFVDLSRLPKVEHSVSHAANTQDLQEQHSHEWSNSRRRPVVPTFLLSTHRLYMDGVHCSRSHSCFQTHAILGTAFGTALHWISARSSICTQAIPVIARGTQTCAPETVCRGRPSLICLSALLQVRRRSLAQCTVACQPSPAWSSQQTSEPVALGRLHRS